MNNLNIYHDKKIVGSLSFDVNSDKFDFKYDKAWEEFGFELTPYIKFDESISSSTIKKFIENLLPEGSGREILSIKYHISKNNIFALIQIIGKETTGAFTFSEVNDSIASDFRLITNHELATRIKDRKNTPISIWDGKTRLSIAGVQDKLPVCIIDDKFGFAEGDLASTHILKFEKNDENIVLNEYLSLKLASKAGLDVAKATILKIEEEEVLLVKRFDRKIIDNTKVKRMHIIDACQALNLSLLEKYERVFGSVSSVKDYREGASFKKIFSLSDSCDSPILTKKKLITWTCVNLCLGNSDAHGKNLSFFINKNTMSLTPFYDIVNIAIYKDKYETDLAMGIDEAFAYDELGAYDFIEFCKDSNINLKGFVKEFKRVANKINLSLENNNLVELSDKNKRNFFDKYKKDVQNRIEKLVVIVDYCLEYSENKD